MGTSLSIYKGSLYRNFFNISRSGTYIFLFLQFQYFPNICFPFIYQALIEGARLDYPTYTITLLTRSLYLYNRLARIITQFARLPSSYNHPARIITQLIQLPSLHNRLACTITQLAELSSSYKHYTYTVTQLIGLASSHKHLARIIT